MATATLPADAARAVAARVQTDPVWFAETLLGHDPWSTPRAIMRAMAQPRARVAVKACHASGKTFTAAEIVLWWTYSGGVVVTTAPTWTQVERLLWGEIHKAHAGARFPLGGHLNRTELRLSADNYAIGLSTDRGVRFQGWHGRVLLVLDEAPGVRSDIYEAIEGVRAGGDVRVLALGNPTVPNGPFFEAFRTQRAGWQTFTIDALETPNVGGLSLEALLALPEVDLDLAPRPYLVTRGWIVEKYHEWGERSPLWQARVRGQFPDQSEDALLSLAWLEAAAVREVVPVETDPWEAGIDVAGPGEDETALAVRHGPSIVALHAWADPDPRGAALAALAPYRERLRAVKVDSIGMGYYFARHLEDQGYRGKVVDVNVAESPRNRERFANLKAELSWAFRQRAEAGDLAGLTNDLALSQLASIRYDHNARGQVVIESKETARKRGDTSPDRAEALMLAYYTPPEQALDVLDLDALAVLAGPGYRDLDD